jgi:Na+-transporting methylmalonyl-CoA/oxaloacetate decarboxylase gamma subunit
MMILGEIPMSFDNITSEHLIIFLVGYTVVFACLAILAVAFKGLPKFLNLMHLLQTRLNSIREKKPSPPVESELVTDGFLSGEEVAAISMALHLFVNELHDEENRILTIKKISRRYSPWSSKIYSVTNGLNKKF